MSSLAPEHPLIPRRAFSLVEEALLDTRVVAVNGPRQCGKSTLAAQAAARFPGALVRTLDDEDMRSLARHDPATFVDHDGLLVIDEIQRVPDLLLAIKARVDRNLQPGQFLLTGSSNLSTTSRVPDTLPGRMEIVDLWPFSQGELDAAPDGFLDAVLSGTLDAALESAYTERRDSYLERVVRGGFPEAVRRTGRRRRAFHQAWVRAIVEHDVPELSPIARRDDLGRLVALMSAHSSGTIALDRVARELELSPTTTRRYFQLLEQTFVFGSLPAWHSSHTTRTVKLRKGFAVDSGIAASVLNVDEASLGEPHAALTGRLVETFVISELLKQASWSELGPRLHHFRTKDGTEVDIVAEASGRGLVGFEVKSSATVRDSDFRGLRHLRARLGDRFLGGVVLHCGTTATKWGDDLWALPLGAIWNTPRP